jgi:hypothetical protein
MQTHLYTCPCCGCRTFDGWPGSYEICHVCFWEDDPVQILDPWFRGGANQPSLAESQENYVRLGAMEERFLKNVRGVSSQDERDVHWRLVAETDRKHIRTPADLSDEESQDLNVWYYWRRTAV